MGNIAGFLGVPPPVLGTNDIAAVFLMGSDPAQLEAQLDLVISGDRSDRTIVDLSLGGGGKGNDFLITVTTAEAGVGPDELYWAVFGASSEEELVNAAAAAKERILAQSPGASFLGQTIVGSAHGGGFCGLILAGAEP